MCLIDQFINYIKEDFDEELRMVFTKVKIREIIKENEAMFSMRAKIRKIHLIFDIDDSIPEMFTTDA